MKLTFSFDNLIKTFFALLLSFFIFQSNTTNAYSFTMDKTKKLIVEELRLTVPLRYKETWIKAEREIWEPWLSKQEGFLGRRIYYNDKKGEALLLVNWENRELWKNISAEEVNKIQNIFEESIKNSLNIEKNPFEFIYEGELFEQK
tara:strand:- start:497 stop:934 length:438 start_codon:yes stop_codon:yes gene_type:complete